MMKISGLLQNCLLRKLPLRLLSTSSLPASENVVDKNKEISKQILESKIKVTSSIKEEIENKCKRWKEKHDIYYGKDRDLVNYPMITMPDYHPKVRLGFLPDEWFNALYHKTGVTGPYLFFWGGLLFLVQKEYWVVDHYFVEVPAIAIVIYILHRYAGPIIGAWYRKVIDRKAWFVAERDPIMYTSMANKMIEIATEDKKCADVNIDLFQATKENIGLQLENVYRNRIQDVHKAVKSRLDYQVEKELSKQRFQRSYMINWIVDSVVKDFSPQHEKVILTQCLNDLKSLGQKLKTVNV